MLFYKELCASKHKKSIKKNINDAFNLDVTEISLAYIKEAVFLYR